MRWLSADLQITGQKKLKARYLITCVYGAQISQMKTCELRNKWNIWLLHSLKRALSSDPLIWATVGFTWLLYLDCAYGSKQSALTPSVSIQRKCRAWRWTVQYSLRPTGMFFSLPRIFLAASFWPYMNYYIWGNLKYWSSLPPGLLHGGLLVHLSLAGRSVSGGKPTESIRELKQ